MATEAAHSETRVNPTEKRVILLAILFTAASLGLIAYATWGLGINVPTCVPNAKLFDRGGIVKHSDKNYEIHLLAEMWTFEPRRLRVPVGSTLDLYVTSKDVTHGMQILNTNVNLMAVPGVLTNARVRFDKPGLYPVVCHEYCGAAHHNMSGMIEVTREATDISAEGLPVSATGRKILDDKGCTACHSFDGSMGVGPSFKGMWGSTIQLVDGRTVKVDAAFVKEIILHPEKNAVKGFDPMMPPFALTEEEINQIEDYLEHMN